VKIIFLCQLFPALFFVVFVNISHSLFAEHFFGRVTQVFFYRGGGVGNVTCFIEEHNDLKAIFQQATN
jgi:hypothetical protein